MSQTTFQFVGMYVAKLSLQLELKMIESRTVFLRCHGLSSHRIHLFMSAMCKYEILHELLHSAIIPVFHELK